MREATRKPTNHPAVPRGDKPERLTESTPQLCQRGAIVVSLQA